MTPTADDVTRVVLQESADLLDECFRKIAHCLEQLSDDQIWWRPHESLNSIGNLCLHLTGNLRQWVLSGLGGAEDVRHRPAEFAERGPLPREQLLDRLSAVVTEAKGVLAGRTAGDMLAVRRIQGFDVTGWKGLLHTVPHFQGHTQEIIGLTRQQLGDGYRFYWQPQTAEQGAPAALP